MAVIQSLPDILERAVRNACDDFPTLSRLERSELEALVVILRDNNINTPDELRKRIKKGG